MIVRWNNCKNEKIDSKLCEIDFARGIDSSRILKTSDRNSRWEQQFDHVNKIIAIAFNLLIFMHMRKIMCTLYSTKHESKKFSEKWLVHTIFCEQLWWSLINKQLRILFCASTFFKSQIDYTMRQAIWFH